jgi:SAM-dependent methyltransferase
MSAPVRVEQRRTSAEWSALGLACPACHGTLVDAGVTALTCAACGATWPVTCGIPDLRTIGDPYLSIAEDAEAAGRLAARADQLAFAPLYASYYEGNHKVSADQVQRFTHGVLAAADRAQATLATWEELGGALPASGLYVDLGSGTGPLAIGLAARGRAVLAVDAGLRWLVLARRRAAEQGIDLPVICANAERLPLKDGACAVVAGESVLENVTDADEAIADVRRVLCARGVLALTTPNRRSLGPDPHLGIMAGGWRSTATLRAYAERTGQVMPRRRLFAPGELADALKQGGFGRVRLSLPRFTEGQRAGLPAAVNAAIGGYHLARRLPVVRTAVLQVAPTLAAVAQRA